jgi:hypothetical protein
LAHQAKAPAVAGAFLGVAAKPVIESKAKQSIEPQSKRGLLRGACHRARFRASRWLAMTRSRISIRDRLENRDIFQQGNHAEDDHDHTYDLLGAAVERQQVDQIQNENNDEKRDKHTY